jgi:hypothetical protein
MITQFTLLLAHGMSLMWLLLPRKLVTSGFFRIQSLVALGLCVLAALAAGQLIPVEDATTTSVSVFGLRTAVIVAAVFAYLSSAFWRMELRTAGTWCLVGIFAATFAGVFLLRVGFGTPITNIAALRLASDLSSAAVLGGATTGMLLGHWYLTSPMMSLEPLKRMTQLWFAALVIRLALSSVAFVQYDAPLHGSLIWTWMSLRWLAGILLPLLLAVMANRILRYRNTQAATGVLFAGVILVFLGEMAAALLDAEVHWPL